MTDQDLTDLLERSAARVPVGPPPLAEMLTQRRVVRRRRAALLVGGLAAAVVVVAVVAGQWLFTTSPSVHPADPLTTASSSPAPSTPTAGSVVGSWDVVSLAAEDGSSAPAWRWPGPLTLTFEDGRLSGRTACNDLFGTYIQRGSSLRFPRESLGQSLVGCAEPPLVRRLVETRHVTGSGDERALLDGRGRVVVELRRRGDGTARGPGPVGHREYALAVALARREIRRAGADVSSATVVVERGRVTTQSNYGRPCTSGHLLVVTLVGDFPHTSTAGLADGGDTTVRTVVVTADGRSGRPCRMGVRTDVPARAPGAVPLDLG